MVDFGLLYEKALSVAKPSDHGRFVSTGYVGAAILAESGTVYVGANIDTACGIGFCAEHSAIAAMITAGETRILGMIAVGCKGNIMPPCGRCREFAKQIHSGNLTALVKVGEDKVVTLSDLLPFDWRDES